MFYERIVISGCKRFSVSGRYHIDLRPTAKVQMILGTNGSGKTTLAQLGFSPLPIEAKWMKKGGYFIKEGTYKGHRYYLEGKYDGKPTFTFKKDGETLLEDGNITPYLDLVRIHLDYNKWLHELLVGRIKFTDLTPQARQDLLSKISKSDFTRAFYFLIQYKKLASHYSSVVKFNQSRINEETIKLLDHETQVRMNDERDRLQSEYESVQAVSIQNYPELNVEQAYQTLQEGIKKYLSLKVIDNTCPDPESLLNSISIIKTDYDKDEGQIQLINKDINEYQQKLGLLETDNEHIKSLKEELRIAQEEILQVKDIPGNIPEQYLEQGAAEAVEALLYVISTLPSELPTIEQEQALRELFNEKEHFLNRCEIQFERVVSELERFAAVSVVKCPSCSNEFKPGVDPELVKTLNSQREKGFTITEKAKVDKQEVAEKLSELMERKQTVESLYLVKDKYENRYPGLFQYINSEGGLTLGRGLISKLNVYRSAATMLHKRNHLNEKITRLSAITEEVEKRNESKQDLSDRLSDASSLLSKLIEDRDALKHAHDYHVGLKDQHVTEERAIKYVITKAEDFFRAIDAHLEKIKASVKQEMLTDIVDQIANINRSINEQEQIKTLIRDFENQLEINKKKAKVSNEIVNTLSPKNGLIAEQISINIGTLLKGLNQLIDKVWGYPLEIRMGTVGDNGLDYKFPMSDSDGERDDVSEGSDSMIEMVNRAVVLMAYYSLDLNDMPLFLDEPGRAFDKVHKLNLIPLIRDLSDSVKFSQIVLISHSEDVQTAFPNSETVILDQRNIDYPHAFNEHVTFTSE